MYETNSSGLVHLRRANAAKIELFTTSQRRDVAPGHGYDNAPRERCGGSLKNARGPHRRCATRAEAASAMREYSEIFYHRPRRHSRLGYRSPAMFVQKSANAA